IAQRAVYRRMRWVRVLTESCLAIATLTGFAAWIVHPLNTVPWIAAVTAIVVWIETGAYTVDWFQTRTLARLTSSQHFQRVRRPVSEFQRAYRRGTAVYAAVPVGLLG